MMIFTILQILYRPRFFHRYLAGMFLLTGAWVAAAEADDKTVELSPFEVQARSVAFKGWTKMVSPNFIVYTDARPKTVRPYIRQMEVQHMIMQYLYGRRPLQHDPITVVLPTRSSDWRKLRSKGEVQWKVAVSQSRLFNYLITVEYDWKDRGPDVLWASLAGIIMDTMGLEVPFGIGKGHAYFFETMKVTREGIRVGDASYRMTILRRYGWLDWDEFFAIGPRSDAYTRDTDMIHRFNGQAAAFVHYWMMRGEPGDLDRLFAWSELLSAGNPPTEELFTEVFGITYGEMEASIDDLIRGEQYRVHTFEVPADLQKFVVTETGVTPREMRDLFVLVSIINQNTPASKSSLDAVLAEGLATEALDPMLVEACLKRKRPEDALSLIDALMVADRVSAETFFWATLLTYQAALDHRDITSQLDAATQQQLISWGESGLLLEPLHVGLNDLMAHIRARGPVVGEAELEEIRARCRALDGNGDTDGGLAALALAYWRQGNAAKAEKTARYLMASRYCYARVRVWMEDLLAEMGLEVATETAPAEAEAPVVPAE